MRSISIPETDIDGKTILIGDKVTVIHIPSGKVAYTGCEIIEASGRRAILIESDMWAFGVGNHKILKED